MNEEKKISNVDKNFNLIDSALKELEEVYETSLKLFEDVLINAYPVPSQKENDKCLPSSNLASRQEHVLEKIIQITNKYVDFNKRCDL